MKKVIYTILLILISSSMLKADYWEKIETLPTGYEYNYWLDIYFHPSNINYGWACGFNGQVVRTSDGGATWQGSRVFGAYHLESIHFPSLNIGYTSGVEGIFKSTDGGASWLNVSPDPLETYWGCFFINDSVGLVIGGGCADGIQRFYRTTNGGNSWVLFLGNEPNSGLTDLMLYPDGTGYAASSGAVWKTNDMGQTWAVHSITGSKVWQEEITNIGNSFLVPTAGATCAGGGTVGGMRFSTNNGSNWNNYIVRDAMFGTFLLNSTTGWACGYDEQVYYTNNAGISWQELSCGIDGADLDDVWFNSPSDGWVVGEGIWRLAPSSARVAPQNLDLGEICQNELKTDTVWVRNLSFYDALCQINLVGTGAVNFSVVSPAANEEYISACDSIPVIVRFNPVSLGDKFCTLNIVINSKQFNIPIVVKSVVSTIVADNYNVVINPAFCGFVNFASINWTSSYSDNIVGIRRVGGSSLIESYNYLPINVGVNPRITTFGCNPLDTGWIETNFEVDVQPCDNQKNLKISAYGVSPIINSPENISIYANCLKDTLIYIPITNSGNRNLQIASAISTNNFEFEIIGWARGTDYPIEIGVNAIDTLIVRFSSNLAGAFNTEIFLENNDSTKARGRKNPSIVNIYVQSDYPYISLEKYHIDFGTICLGAEIIDSLTLRNIGNQKAILSINSDLADPFYNNYNFAEIESLDSAIVIFKFNPNSSGKFIDTLQITVSPCGSIIDVIVEGFAVDNKIELSPIAFEIFAQTGVESNHTLEIISKSNVEQILKAVRAVGLNENLQMTIDNAIPMAIPAGESTQLNFSFKALIDSVFELQLCLDFGELCPQTICLPIKLISRNRFIVVDTDKINFPIQICNNEQDIEIITITNFAILEDTITNIDISPDNGFFRVINKPQLPAYVKTGEKLQLEIEYFPLLEGSHTAELIIKTQEPAPQIFVIPLSGRFEKTSTTLNKSHFDFGYIEHCTSDLIDSLAFSNSGLRADTLIITEIFNSIYELTPSDTLIVPSMDSSKIYIKLNSSKLNELGEYSARFDISSIVCGEQYEVTANAELIKPTLLVTPNPIDFEDVWMDESKEIEFKILNPNPVSVEYILLEIEPSGSGFSADKATGVIGAFSEISHKVIFDAKSEGEHIASFKIAQKSACYDTLSVLLLANVPDEIYYPKFIIDDYVAVPGDTIDVIVRLDSAISRLTPSEAKFEIKFDRFLFHILSVNKIYGLSERIDFIQNKDLVSFALDSIKSIGLLNDSGSKFSLNGLVLLSSPDTTGLVFENINIKANKKVNPLNKDGSLSIYGYCRPPGTVLIRQIPYIETRTINSIGGALQVKLHGKGSQKVNLSIYDLSGKHRNLGTFNLASGENIISIPDGAIASGLLYLLIETEYGQILSDKIIIVR